MNKVVLMGRLTADPETKYTQTNNKMVVNFKLAVSRRFAKEGEKQTDFIDITAWSKTAEFISKYFKKGQQVGIIGRLEQKEWENAEGKRQSKTQVVAEEVHFADSKTAGQADTSTLESSTPVNTNNEFEDTLDDLPF
ncbi:MAG: single-stranded DNA-binding protein [Clostridia bacterium]|jgi:single-strand DNA-binding protein|nr:single-stranded DNA-binding protein [Clostridia bacterium]